MNEYYVYVIIDLDTPTMDYKYLGIDYLPIYIGKGKNKRKYESLKSFKNCDVFILKSSLTEENSFLLERQYIELIGRSDQSRGPLLNKTSGGQGVSGYKYTDEQILDRSISQSLSGNGFYGRSHSSESFNEFKRPVYQVDIETNLILNKFDSLKDASKITNSDENHIRDCCKGLRKSHNGFKWVDADINYSSKRLSKSNSTTKRSIYKMSIDGILIDEYESISSASKLNSIRKSNIIGCLQKRRNTAGGFKWEYK